MWRGCIDGRGIHGAYEKDTDDGRCRWMGFGARRLWIDSRGLLSEGVLGALRPGSLSVCRRKRACAGRACGDRHGVVLHTDCAAVWRVGRREGDSEAVPSQSADVADPGSLSCWNGCLALVVQCLARSDRCGTDGHMCNGRTPVPSVAGRREGLAVAGLCARDDCLCPDLVKLAWVRARRGDYFWQQRVHRQCDD